MVTFVLEFHTLALHLHNISCSLSLQSLPCSPRIHDLFLFIIVKQCTWTHICSHVHTIDWIYLALHLDHVGLNVWRTCLNRKENFFFSHLLSMALHWYVSSSGNPLYYPSATLRSKISFYFYVLPIHRICVLLSPSLGLLYFLQGPLFIPEFFKYLKLYIHV